MKKDITNLFCFIDDFVTEIDTEINKYLIALEEKTRKPTRIPGITISEIMTIVLLFQKSYSKNFKYFYKLYLPLYKNEFPNMPSYERFTVLMKRSLGYFAILLQVLLKQNGKIFYIDSTALPVCNIKREYSNKVFKLFATKSKSTMGWFFGMKLHLISNEKGELVNIKFTQANVDDRAVVDQMTKNLTGFLFGDKGYISQELFERLYQRGLKLVTGIKKNMKNKLMNMKEKILLRKRSISETIFDYLKNKFSLVHTRHRSFLNALVHMTSTLVEYQMKPTKPKINMNQENVNP
jgi:IS5 family transposase